MNNQNVVCTNSSVADLSHIPYTYCSTINNSCSIIDHFLLHKDLIELTCKYTVYNDIENPSDHLPLAITIELLGLTKYTMKQDIPFVQKPKWSTATIKSINMYKYQMDTLLRLIELPHIESDTVKPICVYYKLIDSLHDKLVHFCINSAISTIPFTKLINMKQNHIPEWNATIAPLKTDALYWHKKWCEAHRPRNGYIANMRKVSRKHYHVQINSNVKQRKKINCLKIAKSFLNKTSNKFWPAVKKNSWYY